MLLSKSKRLRQFVGLAETGNWLFLRLLRQNPVGARAFPSEIYRSYLALGGRERWACKSIFEAIPQAAGCRIVLEHLPSHSIQTPLEQLACLALITASLNPSTVFEIGTFTGRTALNFALNSPKDATIYTLDLPPGPDDGAARDEHDSDARLVGARDPGVDYRHKDVEHKIEQLFGSSLEFDFSPYYGSVDLVYVDAAHDYDAVKSDTENALQMVAPGGVVLWDEFCNYGDYNDVTRAVLDVVGADQIVHIENTQLALYHQPLPG